MAERVSKTYEAVQAQIIGAAPAFYYRENGGMGPGHVGDYWIVHTLGGVFVDTFATEEKAKSEAERINNLAQNAESSLFMRAILDGRVPGISFSPIVYAAKPFLIGALLTFEGTGYRIFAKTDSICTVELKTVDTDWIEYEIPQIDVISILALARKNASVKDMFEKVKLACGLPQ